MPGFSCRARAPHRMLPPRRLSDITQKGEALTQQICNHFPMSWVLCYLGLLPAEFLPLGFGDAFLAKAQKDTVVVLNLRLGAAVYQTGWFYLLMALLLGIVLGAAYRLRLRVHTDRVRNLLAERLSERERINRELYDTLLQGMQGLILLFQGVAVELPAETAVASRLEAAISRAERLISEGRDRVRQLRAPNFDLADALRSLNAEQPLPGTEYTVKVNGRERELQLLVSEEIFKIAREAIINACQHACPDHVWVTLAYRRTSLDLMVVDDGRDVSRNVSEDGIGGRWELSGMKSRARKLESRLFISNRSPTGIEVRLSVPGSVAYRMHKLFVLEWLQRFGDFFRRRGPSDERD